MIFNFLSPLIVVIFLFVQGCANPSIVNIKKKEVGALNKRAVIYVPRFEGNPDFVEESTDYFVTHLESNISNTVIQGSSIQSESTDIISGGNIAPLKEAFKLAKRRKANILIMGKVTSHKTLGSLNGFATVRVYNVNSGNRIANFHRPSGLLLAYSEHQCAMSAVKRTAKDVVKLFH